MSSHRLVVLLIIVCFGCKETSPPAPESSTPERGPAQTAPEASADQQSAASLPAVALEPVVRGLAAPTDIVTAPDGSLFVLDQPGVAHRIEQGRLEPFADLRDRVVDLKPAYDERGLLGMAFHPDYPRDRRVFFYYSTDLRPSAPRGFDHTNVLSVFEIGTDDRIDPESERTLLALDWAAPNHDGGTLMFGPDRKLYVSMGDGGKAADIGAGHPPMGNGQDWTTLLGSILRIDPDGGEPYGIPPDNPFVGEHPGADEIWAYGLRNPYAFSFDPKTGRLFAGDVGQDLMEELDIIERGKNYGWSVKEGSLCFDPDDVHRPGEGCKDVGEHGEPLVAPIVEYPQLDSVLAERSDVHGVSIIGGQVYRGTAIPQLQGVYVFGDWSRKMDAAEGVLLAAREGTGGSDAWSLVQLRVEGRAGEHLGMYVRGFGQDAAGEVYVATSEVKGVTGTTGVVWRLVPAGA